MNQLSKTKHPILISIVWTFCILCFYILGGFLATITKQDTTGKLFVQGIFVLCSVLFAVSYMKVKHIPFCEISLCATAPKFLKNIYYFIPIILLEGSGFLVGFRELDVTYVTGVVFITIAVGFSEEIYFRGFVLHTLLPMGTKKAILISSFIFGIAHLSNALSGKNIVLTILQVIFAFIFGIVFAELALLSKSLYPCIILHFLHDCFTYIQSDQINTMVVVLMGVHVTLLFIYSIMLWKKLCVESNPNFANPQKTA